MSKLYKGLNEFPLVPFVRKLFEVIYGLEGYPEGNLIVWHYVKQTWRTSVRHVMKFGFRNLPDSDDLPNVDQICVLDVGVEG
jgi:hypothetical protein